MKKILVIGVLVAAAAGTVFAGGSKEDESLDNDGYGRGSRSGYARENDRAGRFDRDGRSSRGQQDFCWVDEEGNPVTPETVEVEGSLVLEAGTLPYLEQNGEKVFLMVPRNALGSIELEGGEFIKVSGFEMPDESRSPWGSDDSSSQFLRVVSAEIDGETFTLEMGPASGGGRGSRGRAGGRRS